MATINKKPRNDGQKQAVPNTQASLQLLPLIMNNIPQAVFWKDRNLVYLGCNQAFAEDTGFSSPEEVVGKTDFDMPWKDQAELYRADDLLVLENEQPKLNYEEPQTTPDGSTIWLRTSKIPVQEDGKTVAVLGMYEDITEYKRAEAASKGEKQRFQTILETVRVPTIISRLSDGIVLYANQAIAQISQVHLDKLIGFKTGNFYANPDDQDKIRGALRQHGHIDDFEVQFRRTDGSLYWALLSSRIINYEGENCVLSSYVDITERKRAEQALSESEERFRRFSEATVEGLVFHERGVVIDVNSAAVAMTGFSDPKELIGKNLLEFIVPEVHQLVLQKMQSQTVEPYEIGCIRRDGSVFPVETSTRAYKFGDREIRASSMRDITDRKRVEETLRESEARYSAVVTQAKDGVVIIQDNILQFVNDAMADMVGYPASEMINTPIINYIAPESRELIVNRIKARLAGEQVPDLYEARLRRKDGTLFDAELSASAIEYRGRPADAGMIRDITERKRAEQALQESQKFLQTVMDNIPQSIFWKDSNLTYLGCNTAFAADAGIALPSEIPGKNDWDMPWKEQAELYRADDSLVMKSGVPKLNYEEPQTNPQGQTTWLRTSKIPLYDTDGNVFAVLGMYEDITERKRTEAELQQEKTLSDTIINGIPGAFYLFDTQGKMFRWNKQYEQMMGFTPEEAAATNAINAFPDEDKEHVMTAIQRVFVEGQASVEANFLTKDGRRIPYYLTGRVLQLGDQVYMAGTGIDITERKRLEAQVQEAFERRGLQVQLSTQVSQSIAAASSLEELYERVVTQVKEQFGYYHTQLLRYDPAREAVVLVTGYGEVGAKMLESGHRLPMGEGLIGTAAAAGETVLRPALENDPDWHPNPLLPETKGEIAVPIKLGDAILGVLDVQSNVAGALGPDDELLLEGMCGQIAIAIESTRLRQEMTERLDEINRLYRAVSHEGWETYRQKAEIPSSFMFDQAGLRAVTDSGLAEQLFSSIPLTVPGGEVIGSLGVADDPQRPITSEDQAFLQQVSEQVALALESARLFEQTEQQRSELNEALVIAKLANWEYDVNRDRFIFNDHFYSIFHTTVEQVGGYEISSDEYAERFVHPDDRPMVGQEIGKALSSTDRHYNVHLEHRILFTDGGVGHISANVHIERDEQGNIVRYYGANQDITERKLAEEAIAKRATELATVAQVSTTTSTMLDPDQLLQTVVDLTKERFGLYHAHIYIADETWNTLLLAAGAGEVGRKLVADQHAIPISLEDSLVARAARERKAVIVNDVNREPGYLPNPLLPETRAEMAVPMTVGDKLLGVFDVQSNSTTGFSDEDANIYITLATQVGVALQNARLYVEQAALVTQLRELDKLKSSFLANMSHELRTPLNSILGFADVIIEELDGPLTENMSNDLRLIQKNGQHLLHLINDVLDMAKIEAGRMNLNPERFAACEVLEEVTSITSTLASEKNLALFIEPDSDPDVKIYADRTRLRQVMINLVNNAIKFTETGKIALKLVPMEGARILITVKDTGLGIPPDKLDAIFQEFTQVDSSSTRKAGGTGLGLPISRQLVNMHGGRLWVESTGIPGEGSTFFVELPVEARITETIEKQVK